MFILSLNWVVTKYFLPQVKFTFIEENLRAENPKLDEALLSKM